MKIKRGDVVYLYRDVNCPNAIRPLVVVSNDVGNHYSGICMGIPLTTRAKNCQPTHCPIKFNGSTAMAEQIYTFDKEYIERVVHRLDDEDMKMVDNCLRISLGLVDMGGEMRV